MSKLHRVDELSATHLTMCGALYDYRPGSGVDNTYYGQEARHRAPHPCLECISGIPNGTGQKDRDMASGVIEHGHDRIKVPVSRADDKARIAALHQADLRRERERERKQSA